MLNPAFQVPHQVVLVFLSCYVGENFISLGFYSAAPFHMPIPEAGLSLLPPASPSYPPNAGAVPILPLTKLSLSPLPPTCVGRTCDLPPVLLCGVLTVPHRHGELLAGWWISPYVCMVMGKAA